jgi:quercetin dioxygenase-like cupin family protein
MPQELLFELNGARVTPHIATFGGTIQVRVFTLAQGDVIPWHYHRESTDHYFVLQGALTIETRGPDN